MLTVYLLVAVVALFVAKRYWELRKAMRMMHNVSGYLTFLDHASPIASFLQSTTTFVFGGRRLFVDKHSKYASAGWDIIPLLSVWPKVTTSLFVSDPKAIKEICSARAEFPKAVWQYAVLKFFGNNIIASEGEDWKKFKRICAPAFSERTNQLVWNEATRAMLDIIDNAWHDKQSIAVDHCLSITLPLALQVLGMAGFGMKMISTEETEPPPGHQFTFAQTLSIVSEDLFLKLVVGTWCPNLTKRIRRVRLAFDELQLFLTEILQARHTTVKEGRYDVFSSLIAANEDEKNALTDSELIANVFVFVIAGHETTAHTLLYTFALLALYPDEQDKLYEEAKRICAPDLLPRYQDMNRYTRAMAVLNETLRLFPPAIMVPKESTIDTMLSTTNSDGETLTYPVPKGTSISLHIMAVHYNPRYWKDPEQFIPDRFLGDWPRDAFLPFSTGARSCLGKKFFETEAILFIVLLILRYKITVTDEVEFAHETFEEKKARILDTAFGLTPTPKRVPLTFTRRL